MIPIWVIVLICITYLALLFGIAFYGDKKARTKSIINRPIIYALSLTTYCTAWTFYGSVGKASTDGISFLATYLGPLLLCPLWILLFKKIIRICKKENISSISDFIATRYGKDKFLGNLITVMIFLFIIPYISIQLRAISTTFNILIKSTGTAVVNKESALVVVVLMSLFIILFGVRKSNNNQRNEGMVAVIAFEAIFKVIAFISVAIYVIFFVFDGFHDIFQLASEKHMLTAINDIKQSLEGGYWDWLMLIILSFLVFILLPRQFHLMALENKHEDHVNSASWIFPLYLFAITLFVIPIAIAGKIYFSESAFSPDMYVLHFPMQTGNNLLATFVFLGGFAAATGMIIVETIAVSTMLSNNIIIPLVVDKLKFFKTSNIPKTITFCKRISIPIVLFSAYIYMSIIGKDYPLVEIGLISFVGIVQLAPSFFGGLFWKSANKTGTIAGLIIGFILWYFTLLYPTFIRSGLMSEMDVLDTGLYGISALKPYAFLGLEGLNKISHGFFWSISLNALFYVIGSLASIPKGIEIQQANKFIDSLDEFDSNLFRNKFNNVQFYQLYELSIKFIGLEATNNAIGKNSKIYQNYDIVGIEYIDYIENVLSDYIGNISARIVISKLLNEEPLSRNELVKILEETKEAIGHRKLLEIKSLELEEIQKSLLLTNKKLKEIDHLKDEFILTISHELRTPITSIRLLSEMLYKDAEQYKNQSEEFLKTIVQESERLSNLIDDTLLHEQLELGNLNWQFEDYSISKLIKNTIETVKPIAEKLNIKITNSYLYNNVEVYADKTHLERVFINILMNAIKFIDPSKNNYLININYTLSKENIVIIVEDNGIGIAKQHQKKIFNTFVQIQNEMLKTKPKGSGLGLSIVSKILQRHKGEIKVESVLNKYTKFLVTLPINITEYGNSKKNINCR
jgi:Na+/proline symporter/nitrogen-specific signal transduction histidine kinase